MIQSLLHKKSTATSLLEAITATLVVVICFLFAGQIWVNLQINNPIYTYQTEMFMREILNKTMGTEAQTETFENTVCTCVRTLTRIEGAGKLRLVHVQCKNATQYVVGERSRIIQIP